MTRPLRIQYPGALYHVTARGDRKSLIYRSDTDRAVWQQTLGDVCWRYGFVIHAFCEMGNHYHLLVETPEANLSHGMRALNGVYAQYFNRRHDLVGHVFQGRYDAILVEKEAYLLEVARYIVLNPVRARLTALPQDWPWSSYNLTLADMPVPAWLETNLLLSRFSTAVPTAKTAFREFVLAGIGGASPFAHAFRQLILGSEQFIQQFQALETPNGLQDISKSHLRTLALPLHAYQKTFADRDEAMSQAYRSHAYTLTDIARHFGVSLATASRAVRKRG